MYIPRHYLSEDRASAISFMRRFNFALLITSVNDLPMATHLPFVIDQKEDEILISSHMARANPHWQAMEESESLIVFNEPHAYISPTHYEQVQNVPTWNYVAVHVYGRTRLIHEKEKVFIMLEEMMDSFEPSYHTQWSGLSMEYKERMAKGIVAFRVDVDRLEMKEKLSQNKKAGERDSIITSLSDSQEENERRIAEYMKVQEKEPPGPTGY